MIAGIDSSYGRPTLATVEQARAAGVRVWSGYIQTKPSGLASPWTRADFDVARLCGGIPVAFCSGWDDPLALRSLAALWNVRLCLDVESGIRADGGWVQAWLNASGAGLYGGSSVHVGRTAPFHILAAYPGHDPQATWIGTPPPTPHGWQWEGTHNEFGVAVDRGWFDDWFGDNMSFTNDDEKYAFTRNAYLAYLFREPMTNDTAGAPPYPANREDTQWVTLLKNDGSNRDDVERQIADSPEGVKKRATLNIILNAPPSPGSTVSQVIASIVAKLQAP